MWMAYYLGGQDKRGVNLPKVYISSIYQTCNVSWGLSVGCLLIGHTCVHGLCCISSAVKSMQDPAILTLTLMT